MDDVRWLTKDEDRAWRGYRRMHTLLDLQVARDLGDSGLSDADYDVLSTLSEAPQGQWRAGELAKRLLWSTSRLAHHTGRMQRRGLVARVDCPGDGRGTGLALTDSGWATLRRAAPDHVRSVRRHIIDLLDADEVRSLASIAAKVVAHLGEPGPAPEAPPLSLEP